MGRKPTFDDMKPGEVRKLEGLAAEYPTQYKNNIKRRGKYEVEIIRKDDGVYFKRLPKKLETY